MIEGFLSFLQSPEFLTFVATYAGTKLLDAAGSKIKQLKSLSQKKTPEWQFIRCLELAFYTTETELGWEHKTESIYESFEESLLSHQGTFTLASLKGIFETAVGHRVTEEQLEIWVRNFKIELAVGDYAELLRFINIDHYFQSQNNAPQFKTNYILTRDPSVCEKSEIIGREPMITDLLKMLESGQSRIQIRGMGGLGKTETLNKLYARLAKHKEIASFDHICLIQFSGDIPSNIQSQVDCPNPYHGLQGAEAAKRYLQDICQEKKVLLFLDDIREKQPLLVEHDPNIEFLQSLGASILLAARSSFPGFEVLDLEFLSIDECIRIFERQYDRSIIDEKDRGILKDIIENRVGNHTMVVNRLGSMAKVNIWSIPILYTKLEEKNFNFAKSISDDELLQQEINKLYQMSDTLSEAEKNLLEAFSIFPAAPLSADLCVAWLHEDAGVDEDNCARLLNKLAGQTWLEKRCGSDNSDVSFLMHQLVRTAVQEQVEVQYEKHQKLVEHCSISFDVFIVKYDLEKSSRLIPFVISCYENFYQNSVFYSVLTFIATEIMRYYYMIGNYIPALKWGKISVTINEDILGVDHLDTGCAYNNIATVYSILGEYNQALEWYMKDLEINKLVLGENHPDTATTYCNIAGVYKYQGKYKLALEWVQRALDIRLREFGEDHLITAYTYSNLAIVYGNLDNHNLALEWYMKALRILENKLGDTHPVTALIYSNIACIYFDQGNFDLAIEYNTKAQIIGESILGKDHPYTASVYNNTALIYSSLGRYELAFELYGKALAAYKKNLISDHPQIALTYYNIGLACQNQGEKNLALEWYNKALLVFETKLGSEHPHTKMARESMEEVESMLKSSN